MTKQNRSRSRHFGRFAVYAAPTPGPLADFTASWLGWDPQTGCRVDHPEISNLPRPVSEITAAPRRYGFHATLKPPFRLAENSDIQGLESDLGRLAAQLPPLVLPGLSLTRVGGFLALVPDTPDVPALGMAAKVVRALDHHRAPLLPTDEARYAQKPLSPGLRENLNRWGYPWVMDAFRLHFTLTGRLNSRELDTVKAAVEPYLMPLLPRPFVVDTLCLFAEDDNGFFHILKRLPLTA